MGFILFESIASYGVFCKIVSAWVMSNIAREIFVEVNEIKARVSLIKRLFKMSWRFLSYGCRGVLFLW